MSHTDIRNTRLSSIGPLVVTALFCISVLHQHVTNKLSTNMFTLSSDTTQWCGPDLLPVREPQKMDSKGVPRPCSTPQSPLRYHHRSDRHTVLVVRRWPQPAHCRFELHNGPGRTVTQDQVLGSCHYCLRCKIRP